MNISDNMAFTLTLDREGGHPVLLDAQGTAVADIPADAVVKINPSTPFNREVANPREAVDVFILPDTVKIPEERIAQMVVGAPESYRAAKELYDEGDLRVALWLEMKKGVPRRHFALEADLIIG